MLPTPAKLNSGVEFEPLVAPLIEDTCWRKTARTLPVQQSPITQDRKAIHNSCFLFIKRLRYKRSVATISQSIETVLLRDGAHTLPALTSWLAATTD